MVFFQSLDALKRAIKLPTRLPTIHPLLTSESLVDLEHNAIEDEFHACDDDEEAILIRAFQEQKQVEDCLVLSDEQRQILPSDSRNTTDLVEYSKEIKTLSQNAWAARTVEAYRGSIEQFKRFVKDFLPHYERDIDTLSEVTPILICSWICYLCELPDKTSDARFRRESQGKSFSKAQKMRASLSFYYTFELKYTYARYLRRENGTFEGVPTLSVEVTQYSKSLQRRKAQQGIKPESVKALSVENLQKLYRYNATFEAHDRLERAESTHNGDRIWAGTKQRVMMTLIYAISFVCFLRIDETLKLRPRHLRVIDRSSGQIEIHMDYRKTAQNGEIKPFTVYFNREQPWLDVSSLLVEWLCLSGIRNGFLFRSFNAFDRPNLTNTRNVLSSGVFLENFRTNLDEIGERAELYGGHSFRRGGVQYFHRYQRWSIQRCCEWGGWSLEFDNSTIMRYLIGFNDDPHLQRHQFLSRVVRKEMYCSSCGRDCGCEAK